MRSICTLLYDGEVENKLSKFSPNFTLEEYDEYLKSYVKTLSKDSDENIKRYIGIVTEDFQHRVQLIAEIVSSHGEKLDMHTEMIGQLAEQVTEIKMDLSQKADKADVDLIRSELAQKADKKDLARKADKQDLVKFRDAIFLRLERLEV